MNSENLLTIFITLILTSAGWYVAVRRDRLSKKRDLRTQYLIEAYRRLESAGNRSGPSPELEESLESAVADIQLFGSPEQLALSKQFALEFAASGRSSLDALLESLRTDLRRELELGTAPERITYLRITHEKASKK
jgi:hypothetical protein